jgi:MFS family permease
MTQSQVLDRPKSVTTGVALLLLSGIALDIQYGILSPLIGLIAAESNLSSSEVGWVLNASMLGSAVSVGLTSRMGDIYGHRKVLIAVLLLAALGSGLGALGDGFWPLVVGRFLMGIAVTIPLSWGLLRSRATARQVRLTSLGLSLVMAVFTPLALVIGGFVVTVGLPWETVFWVSCFLYAVLLVLALNSAETPSTVRAKVQLDWFGTLGLGLWVTALLVGVSEGPARGWTSPVVITAFAVSLLTLTAWVKQQRRTREPLFSLKDMDVRQTLVGYSGILLISIVGQGLFLVLPSLLQTPEASGFGHGLSPLDSSAVLLALIPGSAVGYLWTRWGLSLLGPKLVLVISGTSAIAVYLGLAFAHGPLWMAYLWTFLYGVTILSCLTTGYTLVAAAGRQDNMAVTVGMQNIIQFGGSTVPIAIILNMLVPGPEGYIPEAAFVTIYVVSAVVIAAFVVIWVLFAPSRISDRHAIDAQPEPAMALTLD